MTYRGIDAQTRRTLHARAALWRLDNLRENHPEDLADAGRHFLACGDVRRAADTYLRAGYSAQEASSYALAVECFQAAFTTLEAEEGSLDAADISRGSAALAKALSRMGELTEADGYWEQALEYLGDDPLTRAGYLHQRAEVQEALGRLMRTRELVDEAARLVEGLGSIEAIRYRFDLARYSAWLRYVDGDPKGAAAEFDALLKQPEAGLEGTVGLALNGRGVAAYGLGDYKGAAEFFDSALRRFEAVQNKSRIRSACNNLGMVAQKMGETRKAVEWYERALRINASLGDRAGLAHTYVNLGSLYGELADFERAEGFLRESIRIWEPGGHANVAVCYANLGEVLLSKGELKAAAGYVERAIGHCKSGKGPAYLLPDAWRTLAEIYLGMGEQDLANEASTEALRMARERKDGTNIGAALRVRGEVCFQNNDLSDALVHLNQAIKHLEGVEQPRELARVYRTLARVLVGEDEKAAQEYAQLAETLA